MAPFSGFNLANNTGLTMPILYPRALALCIIDICLCVIPKKSDDHPD
jgi:hypothetical protein